MANIFNEKQTETKPVTLNLVNVLNTSQFTVTSWNAQGTSRWNLDFKKAVNFLGTIESDFYCLQEIPNAKGKLPIMERLRLPHSVIPDEDNAHSFNNSIILSKIPIVKSGEIVFPYNPHPYERVLWTDIQIADHTIRIYNCHFKIHRAGIAERLHQLEIVLQHAKNAPSRAIICGDMNTTIPASGWRRRVVEWFHEEPDTSMIVQGKYIGEDERYLFLSKAAAAGFKEADTSLSATWRIYNTPWELFNLKLDWLLYRNLEIQDFKLGPYFSDHRPLIATCRI